MLSQLCLRNPVFKLYQTFSYNNYVDISNGISALFRYFQYVKMKLIFLTRAETVLQVISDVSPFHSLSCVRTDD